MYEAITPAARFGRDATVIRKDRALTTDELRAVVPSLFAPGAHESRSQRYTYIPTIDVLSELRKEGFMPFKAMQSKCRDVSKREYTKHALWLRHTSQYDRGQLKQVGDSVHEIVLLNSHDGTSAYQMKAGVFRLICTNGMVVSDGAVQDIRVPHKGDVGHEVMRGAFEVLDGFTRVVGPKVEDMRRITLSEEEQTIMADAALMLRFDDPSRPAPVTANDINVPRRWEDRGNSLWLTANRFQENLTKGGLDGRNARGKQMKTRPVQGLDRDVGLQSALWQLTERMRALKNGEPIPEMTRPAEDLVAA
jgi:hypothetical protein